MLAFVVFYWYGGWLYCPGMFKIPLVEDAPKKIRIGFSLLPSRGEWKKFAERRRALLRVSMDHVHGYRSKRRRKKPPSLVDAKRH